MLFYTSIFFYSLDHPLTEALMIEYELVDVLISQILLQYCRLVSLYMVLVLTPLVVQFIIFDCLKQPLVTSCRFQHMH